MQDSITSSKFLCFASVSFCLGILFASFTPFSLKVFSFFLIPLLFCFLIYPKKKNIVLGLMILIFFLGSFVFYINGKNISYGNDSHFPVFREKVSDMYFRYLPGDEASLMSAIILGEKSLMPLDLKYKLNDSGLRHVAAISGLHISLFIFLLFRFLSIFNLNEKKRYFILFLVLIFYLFLIGFPLSAIRASLMVGAVLIGRLLGRKSSRRIIFTIAAIMLAFNPSLLGFHPGFQLSFGAVVGITYLGPIIDSFLKRIVKDYFWRNFLAISLGVQLVTIPILAFHFSQFSLVSIFSNLAILSLIPLIIGLGIVSSLLGFLPLLGNLLFLITGIILRFFILIVDFFASFSFSVVNVSLDGWVVILYYFILFLFWYFLRKRKGDFLTIF
jgi:competence protein ComEC